MTKKYKVLLAGESWVSTATHIKGFDQFPTVTYHTGADELVAALKDSDFDITWMPAHAAQRDFPQTIDAIQQYDAIILSDLGANTLLLHPDTWIHSKTTPNRLKLLKEYVAQGGGLLMFGGYYSFKASMAARVITRPQSNRCCRSTASPLMTAWKCRKGFSQSSQIPAMKS